MPLHSRPQTDEQLLERLMWLQARGFLLGAETAVWLLRHGGDYPRSLAHIIERAGFTEANTGVR